MRTVLGHRTVAEDGDEREAGEVDPAEHQEWTARVELERSHQRDEHERQGADQVAWLDAAPGGEGDGEAQQVDAERDHPQQGYGRDLRGEVRGDGQQPGGRQGRDRHPSRAARPGHTGHRGRRRRSRRRRLPAGAQHQDSTRHHQAEQQGVAERPGDRLRAQAEQRLDQEWVPDQGGGGAEVAGPVEHVRVRRVRVAGGGEPVLKERCAGAHGHEREADHQGHDPELPEHRCAVHRRADRGREAQGQHRGSDNEKAEMDDHLHPT